MAVINFARREIEAKIVYYGPALSGKTTNVANAHGALPEDDRGDLRKLETRDERTLFFDYVPITRGDIAGFTTKFKLFSVPGQVFYKETRRIVLQGVDGIVFVADSDPERAQANIDSLQDLENNLRHFNMELSTLPLVIQFNKRDLHEVRSVQALNADLNPMGVPIIEAVATERVGVMESLEAVTGLVTARIRDGLAGRRTGVSLAAIDTREQEDDEVMVRNTIAEIERVRPMEEARGRSVMQRFEIDTSEVDAFLLANVERAATADLLAADLATRSEAQEIASAPKSEHPPVAPAPSPAASMTPDAAVPEDLPPGPTVDLNFLPGSLVGYTVKSVLSADVARDGGVALELFLGADSGAVSRCHVVLKPESRYLRTPRPPPARRAPEPVEPPEKSSPLVTALLLLISCTLGAGLTYAWLEYGGAAGADAAAEELPEE